MPTNWYMLIVAALIPMVIGSIWYNPKVIGSAWMKAAKLDEDYLKEGNMAAIFGFSFLFCIFLAFMMAGVVIHQGGAFSMMGPEVFESGSAVQAEFNELMVKYGDNSRTFGHGALHGGVAAVMFALPIIAIISLFERRGWRYIWIHFGYWFISLLLMGGLICATLVYAPLS